MKVITLRSGQELQEQFTAQENSKICQGKSYNGKTVEIPQENSRDKLQYKEKGIAVSPLLCTPIISYLARLKRDQTDE